MKVEKRCKIIQKRMLNPYAVELSLSVGDMIREGSGEFVHIRCGDGFLLRRPISVCSSTVGGGEHGEDLLRIVFEARGEGTAWLVEREAGEYLDVLGLLGNHFDCHKKGRYLLIGGGIGVPPMLGAAMACPEKPTAILGFRSKDREMLLDEFEAHCQQVLLATDDGSAGYHGFVHNVLEETLAKDSDFVGILACGPAIMLKSIVAVAEQYQIPSQVSLEERMGCGVGACLVCACEKKDGTMAHVCKDGPVFSGEEVAF